MHVVTAMIVSPILAVLSYLFIDYLLGERPHKAIAGKAYPMLVKSNCRFESGECHLENTSFKVKLKVEQRENNSLLLLDSSHVLQNVTIGFVDKDIAVSEPSNMLATNQQYDQWSIPLPVSVGSQSIARLALQVNNTFYYAETPMIFSEYKTVFNKDFRKK